jgi:hypothetical protein
MGIINWSDVDVVVPAVLSIPERLQSLNDLLVALSVQCPGVVVHLAPQWKTKKYTFRDVFVTISNILKGATRPWVIYMEEDIELDPNFGDKVLSILDNLEADCGAVSLFSADPTDKGRLSSGTQFYEREDVFYYSQCIAMRIAVAKAWQDMLVPWWDQAPEGRKRCIDVCFGDCCKSLNVKLLTYLPNLVNHRRVPSGYGHSRCPQSFTFGIENGSR